METPPPNPWYSVNAQATVISQGNGPFRSPYVGPHSFLPAYELRTTATATLFFAAKHAWYPIPDQQIQLSRVGGKSNLTQNPGW